MQRSCTISNDHTSDGILFVSWICAVELCTTSNSDHCDIRKLYYLSFTWFPFGIWGVDTSLVACQNCENRVFIDRIVPEKNQVEVTAHLGSLTGSATSALRVRN